MSNEHLSFHHPWNARAWAREILARIDQSNEVSVASSEQTQLSTTMIYAAGGMLAFVIAVDAYVLLRTM